MLWVQFYNQDYNFVRNAFSCKSQKNWWMLAKKWIYCSHIKMSRDSQWLALVHFLSGVIKIPGFSCPSALPSMTCWLFSSSHDGNTAAMAECFVTFEGQNWQMVGGLARPTFLDIKGCLPNIRTKWGICWISNGRICQSLHLLTPKPLHLPLSCDDSVLWCHPIPQYIHLDSVIWPIFHSTSDMDPTDRIAESLFWINLFTN